MESTVVSLFSDYKHGKRFKPQPHTSADMTKNNTRTMPSLTRIKPRKSHPSADSFHQVEVSQRLRCTTTPPPSLQSQSLPRIHLNGNHTRQQNHHSNSYSNHFSEKIDKQLFMPSIQYRATQSLPSLSQSKMSGKSSKKSIYTKDPQKCSTFELFKTSRLGRRTASHPQNFTWDFSPREDESNDNCFPTLGHSDTQSTRPVHLYMSVEMMDKLLEKRKGLRSDAALDALIGLPPSTKKISKKEPLKDSPSVKAVIMKVDESNVKEIRPSILEETTSEELKSDELKSDEPKFEEPKSGEPKSEEPKSEEPKYKKPKSEEPKSEEPKSEEPKSDKDVDNNTSKGKTISKDLQEDEMVCEFEDEEEAELGGLEEEDKDEEFDAAEDEEFDAAEDEEEDADEQEEEFDEVSNDSNEDVNEDFSGQEREGDEMPDTAEVMDGYCDDEEEDSDEELDKQDNNNSDDDDDEDLAGQDKDGGSEEEEDDAEEEEEESDQDEPLENDEEGGELSDEDEQNEASEDDAKLISDDDRDE